MAATSSDKLVKSFGKPTIPPIDGKPTYATIHAMHKLLNSNAASVNTNLVFGTLGHLCVALSPTVCATLLETRVVPPPNPGAMPVIPESATGPEVAYIRYAHNASTLAFNTFRNVYRALQQQLMGSVKDNFVRVKHRPHREYSRSSTLDLLTHLYKTYDIISNANWLANDRRFCKSYSPTNPIEVVCRQINDDVAYSNAGSTTYLPKQVVDNAYQIVFNTGIFAADCREWNKRVAAEKTLSHIHFYLPLPIGSGAS